MADPGLMFRVDISGEEEASRRCQLKGRYIFGVKDSSLCLCDITSNHVLYEWPYVYIRRFGKKRKAFYFEAGRRCTSGEGVFTLETDQYIQIFHAAKEKTTWNSAKEHAVLSGDKLDGCAHIPTDEKLGIKEQKSVGADESDPTYVNISSAIKGRGFGGLHEDKAVGVYSEPDITGTYLTAIPGKQEYRRAISNDDTRGVISSLSDMDHIYSEPYST
ncbi:docking protein 1-like [Haliotis cracherodii]|uniref:docking protein 1-like n=1 Tax=Haliotis cracherodii TaxID=6455 RepID=UPI0039EC79CC